MGAIGSLLRGVILALVIGAIVAIGGALVALLVCGDSCTWAQPASDLVVAPAPGLDGITMAALLGGLLLLGLAIALAPRDAVVGLALVFAGLIAADSFLYWLPRQGGDDDPQPPAAPKGEREPAAETLARPEPALLSCGEGTFSKGGSCVPCFGRETVPVAAKLSFKPLETGAYWQYAKDARVVRASDGVSLGIDDYAQELADSTTVCSARALLVYGSASSDGARDVNVQRAEARAANFANAIRHACTGRSDGLTIFVLSLGQSEASQDVAADRPLSVSIIDTPEGTRPEGLMILDELGYALAEGQQVGPLLARRDRFPEPWEGPIGTIQGIELKPRPTRVITTRTPGAPASCASTEREEGLDAAPFLRQ